MLAPVAVEVTRKLFCLFTTPKQSSSKDTLLLLATLLESTINHQYYQRTTTTMSCDFGPIPSPPPPLQTYFEEQFSRASTANPSRSAPVTKPENKDNIAPQLFEALEKLAEEQQRQDEKREREEGMFSQKRVAVRKQTQMHRRNQSFGQRLWSGSLELWSTLAGEQQQQQPAAVHKVSLRRSFVTDRMVDADRENR